ncbi:unnamed protein product, partial [Mesorhabditis spiculigera]
MKMGDAEGRQREGGLPGGQAQPRPDPGVGAAPQNDGPPPPYEQEPAGGSASKETLPSYAEATRQSQDASNNAAIPLPPVPDFSEVPQPPVASCSTSSFTAVTKGPPLDENEHPYVGLINQAMTCYLNSLIQTLYMTPEFRNSLYRWEYDRSDGGATNIPCQLQKLFVMLQTTDRCNAETTELTNSFGWTTTDAYEQHDIQELCRLMFEALENRWKNTAQKDLIQKLYRGTMEDFVKCLGCGNEKVKPDYFLDLPLAVRAFGSQNSYHSVEEALAAFIQPETLDGDNQYHCDSCEKKQDAQKGFRITQFPYLLSIQLKRFDFDYNTLTRCKIVDRVTFPDVLNLNPFVGKATPKVARSSDVKAGQQIDHEAVIKMIQTEGENVYELFSVMVHYGTANGGHYFAYIKNLDQEKWYEFNDTKVACASLHDINKTFGSFSGNQAVAYMLVYRKISLDQNEHFLRTAELPEHINRLMARWTQDEENRAKQLEADAKLVKIVVQLNVATKVLSRSRPPVHQFELSRENQLGDIIKESAKYFVAEEEDLQLNFRDCRLLECDALHRQITYEHTARNELNKLIDSRLPTMGSHNGYKPSRPELHFLLDVKRPENMFYPAFPESHESVCTFQVFVVDFVNDRLSRFLMAVGRKERVIEVRRKIGTILGTTPHEFLQYRLYYERRPPNQPSTLVAAENGFPLCQLWSDNLSEPVALFIDGMADSSIEHQQEVAADRQLPFQDSRMFHLLDRNKHSIEILVELPNEEEITRAQRLGHFGDPVDPEMMDATDSMSFSMDVVEAPSEVATSASDEPTYSLELLGQPEPLIFGGSDAAPACSQSSSLDDEDELMTPGSFCNNTPLLSPNVSEGGEDDPMGAGEESQNRMDIWGDKTTYTQEEHYTALDDMTNATRGSLIDDPGARLQDPPRDWRELIRVLETTQTDTHPELRLDVDRRLLTYKFKEWLARYLDYDERKFGLARYQPNSDQNVEITTKADTTMEEVCRMSLKVALTLRAPLREGEKMLLVQRFCTEEIDYARQAPLCRLHCRTNTPIEALLEQCRRHLAVDFNDEVPVERLRFRAIEDALRMTMLPTTGHIGPVWQDIVYLEILPEEAVGATGQSIFIRRYRPSVPDFDAAEDLFIVPTAENQEQTLRQAISERSNIPADRLQFVEPTNQWEKFPYAKTRIQLHDRHRWTSELKFGEKSIEKLAGKVLYYRDGGEEVKVLTEEDRKQMNIKEQRANSGAWNTTKYRRHERPLRINMGSMSEG